MDKYIEPQIRVVKVHPSPTYCGSANEPSSKGNLKVEYDKSNFIWDALDAD